ncbi:hypothetical protein [Streptomyces apocyni]|uniref:hypothetical protein n=1 Tax=Streptomyces apocyni TaxID=2654677 RepID=UPI001E2CC80E|nr:hypothetical protein [Streptomyces apocyni]
MGRRTVQSADQQSAFRAGFGVFAECLLTGVWVALAALPLLTLPAALAAGAAHLRRHLADEPATWREFTADLRDAARCGWLVGLAALAALGLLWVDLTVVRAGLPGGPVVAAVGVLAVLGAAVATLRAAVRWRPGSAWRPLLADAGQRTLLDPAGSLLLVCGLGVVAASAWLALPLAGPALGIVVAAALAVEWRHAPH